MRTYDDDAFKDTFEHQFTWLRGFMRNVVRFSDKAALLDPELGKSYTYSQLNAYSNKLARRMQKDGVGPNDTVLVFLHNSPEFAMSYIAAKKLGAIFIPASYKSSSKEIAGLININKPKVVIISYRALQSALSAIEFIKHKPKSSVLAGVFDEDIPIQGTKEKKYEKKSPDLEENTFADYIRFESPEEIKINHKSHIYDESIRLCTSGTTSLPKLVPINIVNEVLTAHDAIMHFGLNHKDITLNTNPWFHRGGLHALGPCPVLYCGGTLVVCRTFKPGSTLDYIENLGITYITGAPANLALITKIETKRKKKLSSLRGVLSLGSVLTKADYDNLSNNLCPNIYNNYGTTETFWNTILSPEDIKADASEIPAGYSCLDDEVLLVEMKEKGFSKPEALVPKDNITEGEIIIRSPAKSSGSYFQNTSMSRKKFHKGFFYTGDTGTWDEHGLITVKGRKDDMIIVSGENIYPEKVENALKQHPQIFDCAVTSVPDKLRGQALAAYLVPKDDNLTIEEVADFCSHCKDLNKHSRPHYFAFLKEIPLNSNGKKKRREIKAMALEDYNNNHFTKN